MEVLGHFNYWTVVVLMMIGFYALIARGNLIKKVVGLNIFQASVFLLFISIGKVTGGSAPIIAEGIESAADMEVLSNLGIEYGQGFFWGEEG